MRYFIFAATFLLSIQLLHAEDICKYRLTKIVIEEMPSWAIDLQNRNIPEVVLPLNTIISNLDDIFYAGKRDQIICGILKDAKSYQEIWTKVEKDTVLPPIPFTPINIIAAGLNESGHIKESGAKAGKTLLFPKSLKVTSAYADIPYKKEMLLDYESEIAFVVSKRISSADQINEKNLKDFIAGVMVANDITDRLPIIKNQKNSFTMAKSKPGFLPLGPFFIPSSSLKWVGGKDPSYVQKLRVNKDERQSGHTANRIKSVLEIIKLALKRKDELWPIKDGESIPLLKGGMFHPGDIILTGTISGVALKAPTSWEKFKLLLKGALHFRGPTSQFIAEQYESPRYLKPGDTVFNFIERLGVQINKVK
ncbi:MAG: fumarylacetoacetate hydrolase family protein [Bacteriovoracaceae bacterium]|jgi:2,4-didehydro-3-deoxy-L-rhamnonate hydrolase|nr:fumarylacetoacetate hydrolase family protein [Bacteriovoracaceae bacterium]